MMDAGGGVDAFLEEHAVIVMSDHSQDTVRQATNLSAALEDWRVMGPVDPDPESAEVAVCPGSRSAQVYALAATAARGSPPAGWPRTWRTSRGWT